MLGTMRGPTSLASACTHIPGGCMGAQPWLRCAPTSLLLARTALAARVPSHALAPPAWRARLPHG
eukprot:351882-Chlamydomonas_euryale.AAC.20